MTDSSSNVTTLLPCDDVQTQTVPAPAKPLSQIVAEISADASVEPGKFLEQTKVPDGGE